MKKLKKTNSNCILYIMSKLKNSELRNDLGHLLKASYLPQKEAAAKLKNHG